MSQAQKVIHHYGEHDLTGCGKTPSPDGARSEDARNSARKTYRFYFAHWNVFSLPDLAARGQERDFFRSLLRDRLRAALTTDLAPLDQFHTRGMSATVELAQAAGIPAESRVLDIGSGLGGPSRYLAATFGCHVTGIDLSPSFVAAATYLPDHQAAHRRSHRPRRGPRGLGRGAARRRLHRGSPHCALDSPEKLAALPKSNTLSRALREIGRIERTLFMIEWYSSPALRERCRAGLNKGEAGNKLTRAVFFHERGEIRDGSFESHSGCAYDPTSVVGKSMGFPPSAIRQSDQSPQSCLDRPCPTRRAQICLGAGWPHPIKLSMSMDCVHAAGAAAIAMASVTAPSIRPDERFFLSLRLPAASRSTTQSAMHIGKDRSPSSCV